MTPNQVPESIVRLAEAAEDAYVYGDAALRTGDSEERLRALLSVVMPEIQATSLDTAASSLAATSESAALIHRPGLVAAAAILRLGARILRAGAMR